MHAPPLCGIQCRPGGVALLSLGVAPPGLGVALPCLGVAPPCLVLPLQGMGVRAGPSAHHLITAGMGAGPCASHSSADGAGNSDLEGLRRPRRPSPSMGLSSLVTSVSFPLWDKDLCRSWRTTSCPFMGELAGHPMQHRHVPCLEGGPGRIPPPAQPAGPSRPHGDWPLSTLPLTAAVLQVLRGWEGAAATGRWPSSS